MISEGQLNRLNEILGAELGRRPDGKPIFAWGWSESLFWPAFATGRKVLKKIEVPLLAPVKVTCPECKGTGLGSDEDDGRCWMCDGRKEITQTTDTFEVPEAEYRCDRQMRQKNVWVMTKWLTPAELIHGTNRRHGDSFIEEPGEDRLRAMWESRYPGAEFPVNGWRIPVSVIGGDGSVAQSFATLPRVAGGKADPNLEDTRWFIATIHEQTRMALNDRVQQLHDAEDAINASKKGQIEAEIRDCFPAFLNPKPGSRSSETSFPPTRFDR